MNIGVNILIRYLNSVLFARLGWLIIGFTRLQCLIICVICFPNSFKEFFMADVPLAQRIKRVKPSPTLEMNARASALKAEGKDIISMGVGEPDFSTPSHIIDAAIKAMHDGKTRYTAVGGTPELKEAVVDKFFRDNSLAFTHNQILISTGGKQCIYNLLQSLINPEDEVIIPAPYWVSYPDMVLLAEGLPVIINTTIDASFKITPDQLKDAITDKTRLLILNSPSNPTGMSYSESELKALGEVLVQHPHVFVATDDMYEHIFWGSDPFVNILNACPALKDRTIVFNGVSKAYAMTGWRIGFAGGPEWLIKAMTKVQSQSTSNPCSVSQAAAVAALNGSQECVKTMACEFERRCDLVVKRLSEIPGVNVLKGDGTFYSFPDVSKAMKAKGITSDVKLAESLLSYGVAVVPGSAFGSPGHLRLSYAVSIETINEAIYRLSQGFND